MLQLTVESGMGATWMNVKSSTTESFSYGSKKSHWEFNDSRIFWIQVNTIKQKKTKSFWKFLDWPSETRAISKFSNITSVTYPKNCLNQTCDYWLITPNQQTFCIETNIFKQQVFTIIERAITKQSSITK